MACSARMKMSGRKCVGESNDGIYKKNNMDREWMKSVLQNIFSDSIFSLWWQVQSAWVIGLRTCRFTNQFTLLILDPFPKQHSSVTCWIIQTKFTLALVASSKIRIYQEQLQKREWVRVNFFQNTFPLK